MATSKSSHFLPLATLILGFGLFGSRDASALPFAVSWSSTATNVEGESYSLSGALGVFDTDDVGPFNLSGLDLIASVTGPSVSASLLEMPDGPTSQMAFDFTDTNPASPAGTLVNLNGLSFQLVFGDPNLGLANFLLVGPIATPTPQTAYSGSLGSGICGEDGNTSVCRGSFDLQFTVVPEPSTGVLLLGALGGLAAIRRRTPPIS